MFNQIITTTTDLIGSLTNELAELKGYKDLIDNQSYVLQSGNLYLCPFSERVDFVLNPCKAQSFDKSAAYALAEHLVCGSALTCKPVEVNQAVISRIQHIEGLSKHLAAQQESNVLNMPVRIAP